MNVHTPYTIVVLPQTVDLGDVQNCDKLFVETAEGEAHETKAFGLGQTHLAASKALELGATRLYAIDGTRHVYDVDLNGLVDLISQGVQEYEFWALPILTRLGRLTEVSYEPAREVYPRFHDTKGNTWYITQQI